MPKAKILTRLIKQLRDKGFSEASAHAIAIKTLQKSGNLKKGSTEPTKKGLKRGNMTPAQRAKDRAIKRSGGKPSDFVYNPKTNSVRRKKKN